ncbi:MAG: MMPL family transporter, partial [Proteobacteria bacterium]|nr:MMPL family transporter [Pseudomonadota bacterium]
FSLHFSLRYQEAMNSEHIDRSSCLGTSARSVGGAILICTLTTAIGFLGFVPTAYSGLADLGIISAGGMFVAALLTFSFLPAFYTIAGEIRVHVIDFPSSDALIRYLIRHRLAVVVVLAATSAGAAWVARDTYFDYSVIALKDAEAESVVTHKRLQADGIATDYALSILSQPGFDPADLESLEVVSTVVTPADFVPKNQEDKLQTLEDAAIMLDSALSPVHNNDPPTAGELVRQTNQLIAVLNAQGFEDQSPATERLYRALDALAAQPSQSMLIWQRGVISNLIGELEWLRRAINAGPIGFSDLPEDLRDRLINENGHELSVVLPEYDITPLDRLNRFIEDVRRVEPNATGRPVIEWGVGQIVTESFRTALLIAIVSIGVILLLIFRRLGHALLIVVPLLLAAVFTLAAGVLFGLPLNMANILVLPLIFGLGVDNGVHVIDRYRDFNDVEHLLHSSTPRAVVLSTLTTIGTFAALSLSPHQGTASIGVLLTIAVSFLLIFTVFLLPVLLSFFELRDAK